MVEGGFVLGLVTYMVINNLEVMPMSTISAVTLLNKFNVKDMSALKEKVVYLGFDGVRLSYIAPCNSLLVVTYM